MSCHGSRTLGWETYTNLLSTVQLVLETRLLFSKTSIPGGHPGEVRAGVDVLRWGELREALARRRRQDYKPLAALRHPVVTGLHQYSQGRLAVFLNFLSKKPISTQHSSEFCWKSGKSVLDSDPYVFGYPGSGSRIICTDPDPFINKQKNLEKLLTVLCMVADPYSFDTDPDPAF